MNTEARRLLLLRSVAYLCGLYLDLTSFLDPVPVPGVSSLLPQGWKGYWARTAVNTRVRKATNSSND